MKYQIYLNKNYGHISQKGLTKYVQGLQVEFVFSKSKLIQRKFVTLLRDVLYFPKLRKENHHVLITYTSLSLEGHFQTISFESCFVHKIVVVKLSFAYFPIQFLFFLNILFDVTKENAENKENKLIHTLSPIKSNIHVTHINTHTNIHTRQLMVLIETQWKDIEYIQNQFLVFVTINVTIYFVANQ